MPVANILSGKTHKSSQLGLTDLQRSLYSRWFLFFLICALLMVAFGGFTRLTGSGLSITEWKPIMGAIPPLTEEQWLASFEKYKAIPQYQLQNAGMSLSDYQKIFFWEYFHRLWGRLIGVFLLISFVHIYRKAALSEWYTKRIFLLIGLGLIQGLIGWLMVTTGFVDRTSVSPLSLSVHFIFANFLILCIYYSYFQAKTDQRFAFSFGSKISLFAIFVILVQIFFGCLVAGNKFGYYYSSFPFYGSEILPLNYSENFPALHSIGYLVLHRSLGVLLGLISIPLMVAKDRKQKVLGAHIFTQVILGILATVTGMNIYLAVLHQITAVATLISSFKLLLKGEAK